ncbi:hypothetical protein PC128_g26055 [Phytophthora cactorum]|nr:hypothetical protein PC128_g26055 [Phytophthora cactorum]
MIPLPEPPANVDEGSRDFSDNVFSQGEESPYFQDSHMVTPRSASRARRLANDCDGSHAGRSAPRSSRGTRGRRSSNRHDDDSSDSDYDFGDQVDEDPREALVRQMDALCATTTSDSGPRLKLASHIPLDRIKLFSGRRNKSDNSMQWLKTFAFEMKATRTRPDEWCAAFDLSLRDGAIHWFRQLPKKTHRKWKPLSQAFIDYYCTQYQQSPAARYYSATRERKEHICDYLNRLNGGKNDSSPEALLNSTGTKGTPTVAATLETEAKAEYDRGDRRDYGRRERREQDRLREDTRRAPRVTFSEAEERDWVADLNSRGPNTQRASTRRDVWSDSEDDVSGAGDLESSCSDGSSSDDGQRQLAVANESERRSAAEGTYARVDRRFRRNNQAGRGDSRERSDAERRERDNRRRSFGPCVACGGRNHSAHYCNRRCKLCKQVHDAGQCKLYRHFQGFVKYARAKEDKSDLPAELRTFIDEGHLN